MSPLQSIKDSTFSPNSRSEKTKEGRKEGKKEGRKEGRNEIAATCSTDHIPSYKDFVL
jgi:DNA invertase Pin-like site-specific DNA recombinase